MELTNQISEQMHFIGTKQVTARKKIERLVSDWLG